MRYKAILVDLDNTLYPYDAAHAPAEAALVAALARAAGRSAAEVAPVYLAARAAAKRGLPPGQAAQHPHPAHLGDDALGLGRGIADQRHPQHRHAAIAHGRE